jgi:TonB family protein
MPAAPDESSLLTAHFGDALLRRSFVASVAVHAAVFGAFAYVTGGPERGRDIPAPPAGSGLVVALALASPRIVVNPLLSVPTVVSSPPTVVVVEARPEPALRPPRELPKSNAPSPPKSISATGLVRPSVSVTDRFPIARFGDFLEGDRLVGFPREIDAPVRLPGKLEVSYPPAALAAREEGTILAFAVIAADGSVEQSHLLSEQPSAELGKAVDDLLRRTRFIPAEDGGKAIRFYVTLEFTFRIESDARKVTADSGASESLTQHGADAPSSPPK